MIEPHQTDDARPPDATPSAGREPGAAAERPRLAEADGVGIVEEFNGWLAQLVERDGSDLHVKVGTPPKFRDAGSLVPLERAPLTHDEMDAIGDAIVPPERVERFRTSGEIDFAYSLPGVGRFRVNVFRQRGSISAVLRKLRFGGPSFDEMGAARRDPPARRRAARPRARDRSDGFGQDHDARGDDRAPEPPPAEPYRDGEDPIEVPFRDDVASINQREVGTDTESLLSALRAALRQIPT